ncbi:MAG TPA: hypothetical protein VM888_07400 [Chitinophagaceae bacterium]|nr:hypothetical protein [Chitinophagaceae bacterium]
MTDSENLLFNSYKIYQLQNKNVFGFKAKVQGLRYTFRSFDDYAQAQAWIRNNGKKGTDYIILEVFKKK